MREINFANEFKLSCKALGIPYWKIPDSFPVAGQGDNKFARFTPPKPFDGFMIHKGRGICIEFKMHKSPTAFAFDNVKPHQIENLLMCQNGGGIGLIVINVRYLEKVHEGQKVKQVRYNKAFVYGIKYFLNLKNICETQLGRKSLAWEHIDRDGKSIDRIRPPVGPGKIWDIETMLRICGVNAPENHTEAI